MKSLKHLTRLDIFLKTRGLIWFNSPLFIPDVSMISICGGTNYWRLGGSPGLGLLFRRLWVRILDGHFFTHIFVVKIVMMFAWKRPKINDKNQLLTWLQCLLHWLLIKYLEQKLILSLCSLPTSYYILRVIVIWSLIIITL